MQDIMIDYTSLSQAVGDLYALEENMVGNLNQHFRFVDLIDKSSGKMSNAINELYKEMSHFEMQFVAVVSQTARIANAIGLRFEEEEQTSAVTGGMGSR